MTKFHILNCNLKKTNWKKSTINFGGGDCPKIWGDICHKKGRGKCPAGICTKPLYKIKQLLIIIIIIIINGGILSLTDSHHHHHGQNPTMVGICHGGNVLGNRSKVYLCPSQVFSTPPWDWISLGAFVQNKDVPLFEIKMMTQKFVTQFPVRLFVRLGPAPLVGTKSQLYPKNFYKLPLAFKIYLVPPFLLVDGITQYITCHRIAPSS